MKLLFLATEGDGSIPLGIPAEMALLKEHFRRAREDFIAIPDITAEHIPSELFRQSCDALHITAHGEGDVMQTITERGGIVGTTPEHLLAFIGAKADLRLIYLNACDSAGIARKLVEHWPTRGVPFAVGTSGPSSADNCTATAGTFYERLLGGVSLQSAFNTADQHMRQASSGRSGLILHCAPGADAALTFFTPQILAKVVRRIDEMYDDYRIVFGIRGAPLNTRQVLFFAPDANMIKDDGKPLGNQSCQVLRQDTDGNDLIWCARTEVWSIDGEFKVHAIGFKGNNEHWFTTSSLSQALIDWHALPSTDGAIKPELDRLLSLIKRLRSRRGLLS